MRVAETDDPANSMEVAVDQRLVGLFSATKFLDEKRKDRNARLYIIENASDLELVRDKLSRILDDVRGVS